MPRRKPPSRLRYEAAHPSLTVRIPTEVRAKVLAAAQAEGLSVGEWVAKVGSGEADSYERGRADGERLGGIAGFRAGLIASAFAVAKGKGYRAPTIAKPLVTNHSQRAVAERLMPVEFQAEWHRLVQRCAESPSWK